mmetsp:Transcript_50339/g.80437  ORF Transcript_50339/g.80437 Transcript_50339/m.80437 type:complete len:202 (+) Transcript_50339:56-661(+)
MRLEAEAWNSCHQLLREFPELAAALVVARLAADLVDAQGAEAAVVHEPVEVLVRVAHGILAAAAAGPGLALPGVVAAAGAVAVVRHHRGQTFSSFLLAHIGLGDRLVERGEEILEDRIVLTEESGFCDAAWIQRRENDAGFLVEATVQLLHQHHVTDLAVLVGLGTIKGPTVQHGHRRLHALLQSLKVSHVRQRRDHAAQL